MSDTAHAGQPTQNAEIDEQTRRDFLLWSTIAVGAAGAALAAWPFIDQMNPAADTLALASTEVDLSKIEVGQSITVVWRGKPVFIRYRTEEEIAEAAKNPATPKVITTAGFAHATGRITTRQGVFGRDRHLSTSSFRTMNSSTTIPSGSGKGERL